MLVVAIVAGLLPWCCCCSARPAHVGMDAALGAVTASTGSAAAPVRSEDCTGAPQIQPARPPERAGTLGSVSASAAAAVLAVEPALAVPRTGLPGVPRDGPAPQGSARSLLCVWRT